MKYTRAIRKKHTNLARLPYLEIVRMLKIALIDSPRPILYMTYVGRNSQK